MKTWLIYYLNRMRFKLKKKQNKATQVKIHKTKSWGLKKTSLAESYVQKHEILWCCDFDSTPFRIKYEFVETIPFH